MAEKVKKALKKTNTLDKYMILSFTVIILYTISHTFILGFTGNESAVLTVCVFGFFAEEIALCAFLKRTKLLDTFKEIKGVKKQEDDSDEPFTDGM